MKTEKQSCCFCFNIALKGNIVDEDILDLLKFLMVNVDKSAFENSTVCNDCLNKIVETYEYKTKNSSKMLVGIKKEIYPEKTVICQKCEIVCEQGDSFLLVDCVTQIDWSDFVNYLFLDQDSQSLENSQICGSCQISVSNIQQFLKLIFVHDPNKIKCDVDYCNDIKVTGCRNLVENKIKQEFENYIIHDKIKMENVIEDNKTEVDNRYADFQCKNEEVDLKLENDDDNQSTVLYEKVHVGEEIISSGRSNLNSSIKEDEQGCSSLRHDQKAHSNILGLKCTYCSKQFVNKLLLDDHLLKNHKCKDNITSIIHSCDKCSYLTTQKSHLSRHKLQHGIEGEGVEKHKCQYCVYETYNKQNLNRHTRIHYNVRDFKCPLCSKEFTVKQNLDYHLLKTHKCRDKITSKTYQCDKCSYVTVLKYAMVQHNLKHGIKGDLQILKCHLCTYETYNKNVLIRHIRIHNPDFKCTLCSKIFTWKRCLDDHLLKIHKNKDHVSSKIHECDTCSYATTRKSTLLKHKLKHGKVD